MKEEYKTWARFIELIPKYKWLYMLGVILKGSAEAGLYITVGLVSKNVINAIVSEDRSGLTTALGIAFIQTLVCVLVLFSAHYVYNRIAYYTIGHLKSKLFHQILHFSERTLKENHSGNILSRMTNDAEVVQKVLTSSIYYLCFALIFGIGSLVVMLQFNWKYALVFTGLSVLMSFINARLTKGVSQTAEQAQRHLGKMTEKLTNLLSGLHTIKMFEMEKKLISDYSSSNREATEAFLQNNRRYAFMDSVNYAFSWVLNLALFSIGCLLLIRGTTELGELVAIGQLLFGINFMLNNVGRFIIELQSSIPALNRISELINVQSERTEGSGFINKEPSQDDIHSHIELRKVTYHNPNNQVVLKDTQLLIMEGQLAAITGPSGAGKSTLMKLLLGFVEPLHGEIFIGGKEIREYSMKQLRQLSAYVPQNSFLFSGSIADNIRHGKPGASDEALVEAAKAAYAHEFIMALPNQYGTIINENSTNLSGGQKQRIALARAFIKDAPILLLDEATSSLDYESEGNVLRTIHALRGQKTVLMISHRSSAYVGFEPVIKLEHGEISES